MVTLGYALAWLVFALLHSLLARPVIQKTIEGTVGRWYRLLYNVLAMLKISIVLYLGNQLLSSARFPMLDNHLAIITSYAIQLVGFILLLAAFSTYDKGRFAGITQLCTGERVSSESQEPLQRKGLNRFARHPLYTAAFIILWGGAVSPFDLWTAIWGTLYFLIGTIFEERKLIGIYGDEYRRYQREVPRYFPTGIR